MKIAIYKPLLQIVFLSTTCYVLHKLIAIFILTNTDFSGFIYSIEKLYFLFFLFAFTIVYVLIKIKQKNIDNVGYTFLLLTSVKMVVAYIFLLPILKLSEGKMTPEKINFLTLFILFLAIETVVTVRILNKN